MYDPRVHLNISDASVDDCWPVLGQNRHRYLPSDGIIERPDTAWNITRTVFILKDRIFSNLLLFRVICQDSVTEAGVDQSKHRGYSFHIGTVTTMTARGMEDPIV